MVSLRSTLGAEVSEGQAVNARTVPFISVCIVDTRPVRNLYESVTRALISVVCHRPLANEQGFLNAAPWTISSAYVECESKDAKAGNALSELGDLFLQSCKADSKRLIRLENPAPSMMRRHCQMYTNVEHGRRNEYRRRMSTEAELERVREKKKRTEE